MDDSRRMVPETVRTAVEQSLTRSAFFAPTSRPIRVDFEPALRMRWEMFAGRLLDAALTRQEREFAAWQVRQSNAEGQWEDRISVLYSEEDQRIYVLRHLEVYGFEAFESEPNVIDTRPVQKWTRELMGEIEISGAETKRLAHDCGLLLFQAVCGASRLPVASHESQLPAFAVGELGYWPSLAAAQAERLAAEGTDEPAFITQAEQLVGHALDFRLRLAERAKMLELALRATGTPEVPQLACHAVERLQTQQATLRSWLPTLRRLFHGLGLTPYIDIDARLASFLGELMHQRSALASDGQELADLVALFLLQLARHLAAFDLKLFHNFGADYPDLLLLDALLELYDGWFEQQPELFLEVGAEGSLRRRRVAWLLASLLRNEHEGLRVPEAPTSPGENQRVLPAPLKHVDDAEIMEPRLRRKRLFAERTWNAVRTERHVQLMERAVADLACAECLAWAGEALFLDRPLGAGLPAEAVDDTPLVAYLAFSRGLAQARMRQMQSLNWLDGAALERLQGVLSQLEVTGIAASDVPGQPRLGVVSLADARMSQADFVFVRTMPQSLRRLLRDPRMTWQAIDDETRAWLEQGEHVLLIRTTGARQEGICLAAYDTSPAATGQTPPQARAVFWLPDGKACE